VYYIQDNVRDRVDDFLKELGFGCKLLNKKKYYICYFENAAV